MTTQQDWKTKYEKLSAAVKQVAFLSGNYGEAMKSGITVHSIRIKEAVVYDIQQALK